MQVGLRVWHGLAFGSQGLQQIVLPALLPVFSFNRIARAGHS